MNVNFSGQNLQEQVFNHQDLTDANFSGADIRGVKFIGTNLTNANFSNAQAGLTQKSQILLFILALITSMAAGAISGIGGQFIQDLLNDSEYATPAIVISIVLFIIFLVITFSQGLGVSLKVFLTRVLGCSILVTILIVVTKLGNGSGALAVMFTILLTSIITVSATLARALAGSMANFLFVCVAISGVIAGKSFGAGLGGTAIAMSSVIISKRAIKGNRKDAFILDTTLKIISRLATSFQGANLNNADFTMAKITHSDFRSANLTNICWQGSQKLNLALFDNPPTNIKTDC